MVFERKKIETGAGCVHCSHENNIEMPPDSFSEALEKPSVLLHSCCGPCSTAVVERLVEEFNVTVFFYNPCITEEEEYNRRRCAQISFIKQFNLENTGKFIIKYTESDYRPADFLNATASLESEPEGGARCRVCFRQRLEKTAETASLKGYDLFGTTLTVSPHKNYGIISETGRELAVKYGVSFLDRDFKKKDGFTRSIELSKKYDLYRQNYCGCKYSKR